MKLLILRFITFQEPQRTIIDDIIIMYRNLQ